MTVYVDKLMYYTHKPFGYSHWCHLWADSLGELHDMAELIGLKHSWFQNREGFAHYDLVGTKRILALQNGAVEKSLKEWIREHHLEMLCRKRGIWTIPPYNAIPHEQWADALLNGYTDRYLPLPQKQISEEEYEKMRKEMYGE